MASNAYTGISVTATGQAAGLYDLVGSGARGGAKGGLGAEIGGDVSLITGEMLTIAVGPTGRSGQLDDDGDSFGVPSKRGTSRPATPRTARGWSRTLSGQSDPISPHSIRTG